MRPLYLTATSEPQTPCRVVENIGQGLESSRTAGATNGHNWRAVAEAGTTRDKADMIGEQQHQLNGTRSVSSSCMRQQ